MDALSSKKWASALTVVALVALPVGWAGDAVAFDPQAALTQMYGGDTWKDPRLTRYFQWSKPKGGADVAYVSLGFDAPYTEGGHRKHVVVSILTPDPPDQYGCHACTPLIGAAVFTLAGSSWQLESVSLFIEDVASGHRFTLVRAGPDRYALQVHQQDDHQGYELDRIDLLVPYQKDIRRALTVGFNESPSPGACGDGSPQATDLNFDTQGAKEFYDALTVVRKNAGECGHLRPTVEQGRYTYAAGVYRLVR
jgi:hypothetical protein